MERSIKVYILQLHKSRIIMTNCNIANGQDVMDYGGYEGPKAGYDS